MLDAYVIETDTFPAIMPIYTQPSRDRTWLLMQVDIAANGTASGRVQETRVPWEAQFADINGDGLSDFFQVTGCERFPQFELCQDYGPVRVRSWLNTGDLLSGYRAFVAKPDLLLPSDINWRTNTIATSMRGSTALAFVVGNIIVPIENTLGLALGPSSVDAAMRLARVIDYDGDGRQDILLPAGSRGFVLLRSHGEGFEFQELPFAVAWEMESAGFPPPSGRLARDSFIAWGRESPTVLDLNGDGIQDFLKRHFPSGWGGPDAEGESEWQVMLRQGPSVPRLVRLTDGLGRGVDTDYALLSDPTADIYTPRDAWPCVYPQRCAALRRSAVSAHRVGRRAAGGELVDVQRRFTYIYQDGRTDLWGRGFVGFETRAVHMAPGDTPAGYTQSTITEFDNRTRDPATSFYYKAFVPARTTTSVTEGDLTVTSSISVEHELLVEAPAGTIHRFERRRDERLTETRGSSEPIVIKELTTLVELIDRFGNPRLISQGIPNTDPETSGTFTFRTDVPEGWRAVARIYMHESDPTYEAVARRHLPSRELHFFLQTGTATPWGDDVANSRVTDFGYFDDGSLRQIIVEPGPVAGREDLHKIVDLVRDGFGNVEQKTETLADGASRVQQFEYVQSGSRRGHFPIEIINFVDGQEQRFAVKYDPRFGELTQITDPNGVTEDYYFDGFGRLTATVSADGSITDIEHRAGNSLRPLQVYTRAEGGLEATVEYDAFGRAVHRTETGVDGHQLVSDAAYDDLGRVLLQSRPHRADVSDLATETAYSYDALGRVVGASWLDPQPGGAVSVAATSCHEQLRSCHRNARGFTSCDERDRVGHVVRHWDSLATPGAELLPPAQLPTCEDVLTGLSSRPPSVRYSYGEFLERVADPAGNLTRITVDPYGRGIVLSDPSSGITKSRYNGFGELVRTEDANGQVTEYEHDELGRVEVRRDIDLLGAGMDGLTSFHYDGADPDNPALEPGEFIGSLTLAVSPEGHSKRYEYDAVGQLTQVEQTLANSSVPLAVRFEDYEHGQPRLIRYPSAGTNGDFAVRRTYDTRGRLLEVRRDGQPTTAPPLWQLDETNFYDQISQETLGNGVVTETSYDTLGRMSLMTDNLGAIPLRVLGLHHDVNGNVISRSNGQQSETFLYDHLDRLRFATVGTTQNEVRYDELGNIEHRSEVGNYGYFATNSPDPNGLFLNQSKPYAATHVGTRVNTYNAAGEMSLRVDFANASTEHYSWTPFGKIAQMWRNGLTPAEGEDVVTLSYDAAGDRIQKHRDEQTTTYLEGMYERRQNTSGTTEHVYYVGNGARVIAQFAVVVDGTTNQSQSEIVYLHADHLGSPELLTGEAGTVHDRRSYGAFGSRRNTSDWNLGATAESGTIRVSFTGHEPDDDYDLVHMIGRHYDPQLGRFLSADPFVDVPNSQGLNRYSYVINNPLRFRDPNGYENPSSQSDGPLGGERVWVNNDQVEYDEEDFPDEVVSVDVSQRRIMENAREQLAGRFLDQIFGGLPEDLDPSSPLDRMTVDLDSIGNPITQAGPLVDVGRLYHTSGSERAVQTTGLLAASVTPGIGESMDIATIADARNPTWVRVAATFTLALGILTAGLFPNVGAVASRAGGAVARGAPTRFVAGVEVRAGGQTMRGTVDLGPTLKRIESGGSFPHRNDGSVFMNREGLLPNQAQGYYREFVHPTPGVSGPAPQRIIQGQGGEMFYTPNHYRTFIPLN